jgi:hypothetical protein
MNILHLFLPQRGPPDQGAKIIIQIRIGFEGIEEDSITIIDDTSDFRRR